MDYFLESYKLVLVTECVQRDKDRDDFCLLWTVSLPFYRGRKLRYLTQSASQINGGGDAGIQVPTNVVQIDPSCFTVTEEERGRFRKLVRHWPILERRTDENVTGILTKHQVIESKSEGKNREEAHGEQKTEEDHKKKYFTGTPWPREPSFFSIHDGWIE